MKLSLLEILACPNCSSSLECHAEDSDSEGDVFTGQLKCLKCENTFPVIRGIPRFVPNEDYAGSFGFQWNQFRSEQLDSTQVPDFHANVSQPKRDGIQTI